jgi:hypothetical protein
MHYLERGETCVAPNCNVSSTFFINVSSKMFLLTAIYLSKCRIRAERPRIVVAKLKEQLPEGTLSILQSCPTNQCEIITW